MKTLELLKIILKGGIGSGNWGHASKIGRRGGSLPRGEAMSINTGRDAERRQKAAKSDMFFKGNTKSATVEDIYNGSSQQIKDLADATGILATDEETYRYVRDKQAFLCRKTENDEIMDAWAYSDNYRIPNDKGFNATIEDLATSLIRTHTQSAGLEKLSLISMRANLLGSASAFVFHYMKQDSSGKLIFDPTKRKSEYARDLTPDEQRVLQEYASTFKKVHVEPGKKTDKYLQKASDADIRILKNLYMDASLKKELGKSFYLLHRRVLNYEAEVHPYSDSGVFDATAGTNKFLDSLTPDVLDSVKQSLGKPEFNSLVKELYAKSGLVPSTKKLEDFKAAKNKQKYDVKEMLALSTVSSAETSEQIDRIRSTWDKKEHGGFTSKVHNVFRITANKELNAKFDKLASEKGNVVNNQFHGTHHLAARDIASGGYKVIPSRDAKTGRMLGDGIYTSDCASKVIQYIGDRFGRGDMNGVLFLNKVVFGKQAKGTSKDTWSKKDVDSVYGVKGARTQMNNGHYTTLVNDEYVVKDPAAILPMYWIDIDRISK